MTHPIEFFDIPYECEIEIEYDKHKFMRCNCVVSMAYGSFVTEVYDSKGEIIATSLENLLEMGATKVTVILKHEVEF